MQKVETFTHSIYPYSYIKENIAFKQKKNKDNNLNDKKSK